MILSYFTWATLAVCCILLWLQHVRAMFQNAHIRYGLNYIIFQSLIDGNISDLSYAVLYLCTTIGQIFLFCYFGDLLTAKFETISEMFYQCNWYLMMLDIQKLMPTILCVAQEPVYLSGIGNISCTRVVFKRVIAFIWYSIIYLEMSRTDIHCDFQFQNTNTAFSYFMMLRHFGK